MKVTVTPTLFTPLRDHNMCPQTEIGIPMSNNIGFLLETRFFF